MTLSGVTLSAIHQPPFVLRKPVAWRKDTRFWQLEVSFLACSQNEFALIQPLLNKGTSKLSMVMVGDLCLTLMMKVGVNLLVIA